VQRILTCFLDYSSHLASKLSVARLKRATNTLWPGRYNSQPTPFFSIMSIISGPPFAQFHASQSSPALSSTTAALATPPVSSFPAPFVIHSFACANLNLFSFQPSRSPRNTAAFPHLTGSIIKVLFINPLRQKGPPSCPPAQPAVPPVSAPFVAGGISGGLFLTHQTRSSNRTRFCDTSVPNLHPSHPHKQLRPIGTILKTDSNILVRHT
jgi:hypothetical protein